MPVRITKLELETVAQHLHATTQEIARQRELMAASSGQKNFDLEAATARLDHLIALGAILEGHQERMRAYLKDLEQQIDD
jgi:hypothetical protein